MQAHGKGETRILLVETSSSSCLSCPRVRPLAPSDKYGPGRVVTMFGTSLPTMPQPRLGRV
jgi:hypothetical protein